MSNDDIPSYSDSQSDVQKGIRDSLIRIDQSTQDTNTFFKNTSFGKMGASMGAIAMEGISGVKDSFDVLGTGMNKMYEANIKNIEEYRKVFGGLRAGEAFTFVPQSAVSNAISRFETVKMAFANNDTEIKMGMEKTGAETLSNITNTNENILKKYFDSAEEAAMKSEDILTDLSTTYGNQVAKLTDEQVVKLSFYEDSLGVSADTIKEYFQKQIGFTDEITLESMDKIGMYANNLSQELNIPMKTLTGMTMKMMSNTQMFGDITAEEATRMSAKLTQLGYTYEELNEVQNKFATFSGAAKTAGTIAQLTGAQLDASKMSYLTSEGSFDELIEYQRESLLKAGDTKEKFLSQSNSLRNAVAEKFGRSQEEFALLLDNNRKISSQSELDEMMGKSEEAAEQGFDILLENLNQTKNAFKSVEEIAEQKTKDLLSARADDAFNAAEKFSKMNTGLMDNTNLLGESQEKFNRLADGFISSMNQLADIDSTNIDLASFTSKVGQATLGLGGTAIDVMTQAKDIAEAQKVIGERVSETTDEVEESQRTLNELKGAFGANTAAAQESQARATETAISNGLENAVVNMPAPELNLSEGAIQVIVDSTKIPIEGLKVRE